MPQAISDVVQPEKLPVEQPPTPDISSVEADNIELKKYATTLKVPIEQVIPTLTAAEQNLPLPTERQVAQLEKDQTLIEVEGILEKDMLELYKKIPDSAKLVFKQQGEKTALDIATAIKQSKFDPGQAFEDVDMWLKHIPGTNRRYLEQSAKLITDKLDLYYTDLQKPKNDEKAV